jgi:xanthine/uracil permease
MEGDSWWFRAALCDLLSLVALIALISIIAGNYGGFPRNLLQGIIVTGTCFVLLAVVPPAHLERHFTESSVR